MFKKVGNSNNNHNSNRMSCNFTCASVNKSLTHDLQAETNIWGYRFGVPSILFTKYTIMLIMYLLSVLLYNCNSNSNIYWMSNDTFTSNYQ